MTRPIDADAIFPWYVEAFKGEIEPHDVRFSMHDIEMNLSNIPTIDAVPVIRCKDCKHRPIGGHEYNHTLIFPDERCPCNCFDDNWYSWMPDDNWFCGNGEREEE